MNQTWKVGNILFSDPILGPKIFFMDFTSIRCYELLQAIIVSNFKEN